jgi:hypothetical protein
MSLCYFRLQDYRKSIKAAEDSLESNREFPKAYYRLYKAYLEIADEEYQVFINSHLFLKYFQEENQSNKAEALGIMREFKEKFKKKSIATEVKLEEDLITDLYVLGKECINGSTMEVEGEDVLPDLMAYFDDQNITLE